MKTKLHIYEVISLGLTTFALFAGSGNIIFPPMIGLQAGFNAWPVFFGFLLTAIGLPLITIFAVALQGGGIEQLTRPAGHVISIVMAFLCYLFIGPLFIIPRTATVAYSIGIVPFSGEGPIALFIFSLLYFSVIFIASASPGKMIEIVGKVVAPVKIVAFFILGFSAFILPAGSIKEATDPSVIAYPVHQGVISGYGTMDTFGALAFGVILLNFLTQKKIINRTRQIHYVLVAGIIAAVLMSALYFGLFRLGQTMGSVTPYAAEGAVILAEYTNATYGVGGAVFLGFLVILTCLVTCIGLMTACTGFFSNHTKLSYRPTLVISVIISVALANIGLEKIISLSIPVLVLIYPPCITVVFLSFLKRLMPMPQLIFKPSVAVAAVAGALDAINASPLAGYIPLWVTHLPMFKEGMCWLIPTLTVATVSFVFSKILVGSTVTSGSG